MKSLWGGDYVNDQPTPIVKLPQACEYAQLSNFAVDCPLEFSIVDVINMQYFMDKLNKKSIFNINKHHRKTIGSYFHSV
jgi:hypothetical protein